ncbi:MAG: hypothetical protein KAQ98_11550 [Bacteriovoracaceae bacterium]|nr:hypothetical protein [Bacteriovoracaceae bacterium]
MKKLLLFVLLLTTTIAFANENRCGKIYVSSSSGEIMESLDQANIKYELVDGAYDAEQRLENTDIYLEMWYYETNHRNFTTLWNHKTVVYFGIKTLEMTNNQLTEIDEKKAKASYYRDIDGLQKVENKIMANTSKVINQLKEYCN